MNTAVDTDILRATEEASAMFNRIEALQPMLLANAELARSERRVPQENIDALQQAGFFLALQPSRWGGYQLDPQAFFRMQLAIAEYCMSTAWASGIVAVHAFQIALMDERAQQDVWGDSIHTRISSSYAPMGKVEAVDGGFRFSGRWGWSSGCDHCSWALLGGILPDGTYRTFLVPESDYRIEDTWHSMGLQGTGSNDVVVEDVFVPDYRTHKQSDGFEGTNPGVDDNSATLYHLPWAQIFIRVVSTPAIGASSKALSLYTNLVKGKASDGFAHDRAPKRRFRGSLRCGSSASAGTLSNQATGLPQHFLGLGRDGRRDSQPGFEESALLLFGRVFRQMGRCGPPLRKRGGSPPIRMGRPGRSGRRRGETFRGWFRHRHLHSD